ncbi:alanine--glyoxylate aminotransferase family protein [bacterium]|nr:alanine--glyoxylate aminotransferase family protein [bacterium]
MKQFIVGPVEMYPSTKNVLEKGYTYFRTQEYGNMVKECLAKVAKMMGAENCTTIYLAASGTGAMDAVVDNCMGENDKALVINGGSFGHRFCELLKWYNIPYDSINLEWNEVIEAKDLEPYENKGYTALFVNLDETSSGKLYDIKLISDFCKRNNMYLIVDAISTFLADDYDMEKWGIDVTIISSQKGLCLSPGMSIVAFSKRMVDKINREGNPNSYYFDFKSYFKNIERGQTPFTTTVSIMYELKDMLELIEKAGGKDAWIKIVQDKANYFRKRATESGLTIPDYPKSYTVTPVVLEGVNANDVVKYLRENYEICVNPCGGELGNKMFRVAHIGNTTMSDIDDLLENLLLSINAIKVKQLQGVS